MNAVSHNESNRGESSVGIAEGLVFGFGLSSARSPLRLLESHTRQMQPIIDQKIARALRQSASSSPWVPVMRTSLPMAMFPASYVPTLPGFTEPAALIS